MTSLRPHILCCNTHYILRCMGVKMTPLHFVLQCASPFVLHDALACRTAPLPCACASTAAETNRLAVDNSISIVYVSPDDYDAIFLVGGACAPAE
jgi:hypothetical protein